MTKRDVVDTHAADRLPRLGVALTGSGFRAAFFHVGVLAQLARLRLLRRVEVLSTVSGGSLVGSLYYLHLKNLLESRSDGEIEDADYVVAVGQVERDLVAGAARNVAALSVRSVGRNLRMMRNDYSRSDRIGELYDELFFRPAWEASTFGPPAPRLYDGAIQLRELVVRPAGAPHDFHPGRDNAARAAKVPVLLITATTLNTGHIWRFEATRMGEPPQARDAPEQRDPADVKKPDELVEDLDRNMRLRPVRSYHELGVLNDISVGLAVAASSAVPALLPPVAITGLYPDVEVQLVDGSLSDPMGVQGLLYHDCGQFVVSNGGRGLFDVNTPSTAATDLNERAAAVGLERLRAAELSRLRTVGRRGSARTALLHLRKGLLTTAVPWISSEGIADVPARERTTALSCEDFGVAPEVQESLSRVRTAFGAFTEVEASSLMLDAYRMSGAELTHLGKSKDEPVGASWDFDQLAPLMSHPAPEYLRQLRLASIRSGKVALNPALRFFATLVAFLFSGAALGITVTYVEPWLVAVALAFLALGYIAATRSAKTAFGRTATRLIRFVVQFVAAFVAPVVVLPLRTIDRVALRAGASERLLARIERKAGAEPEEPAAARAPGWSLRSPKPLVFVLAVTAFTTGCVPLALLVGHAPLVAYLGLLAMLAAWLSLRRISLPTERSPSYAETALAWAGAVFAGAVISLFSLLLYEAVRLGVYVVGVVVRAAGGGFRPDESTYGLWAVLIFSLPFGYALAGQTARGLAAKLYPRPPGTRSVYHGLAVASRWKVGAGALVGTLVAIALVAASVAIAAWFAWLLEAFMLVATGTLWGLGGRSPVVTGAHAVDAIGKFLTAKGFEVKTDMSTPGVDVSPLVEGVDMVATTDERTLVIEVKTGATSAPPLDWTAASGLRLAASALANEAGDSEPGQSEREVEPVLVLVGVDADASLNDFADQLDVKLLLLPDETALDEGGDAKARTDLERSLNLPTGSAEGGSDAVR